MVENLHRVDYDGKANRNGHWWVWKETCDRCGELILDESTQHSTNRDAFDEANFCTECIQYLMKNNIPYRQAVKIYRKNGE